jgi:hypothetical protein
MEMGGQVGRWEAKQGDGWLSKYIGGEVRRWDGYVCRSPA